MPRTLHKLPTVLTPLNEIVLPVLVPDDIAYVRAVSGQLGNLGMSSNWERDIAQSAYVVAQNWRNHYNRTLELWEMLDYNLSPITINCGGGE